MGQLCSSFETMRGALEENNHSMWRTMEERKRLNAAFSHDLRTPLTVLRGYVDLLGKYLPQGKISEEKLLSTVSTMSDHITRMENYVRLMGEVQKLEDVTTDCKDIEPEILFGQLQSTANMLVKNTHIRLIYESELQKPVMHVDEFIVMRVYENLIANAVRYAHSEIIIRYQYYEGKLQIIVSDDGKGFTEEDLQQVTKPYYRNKAETEELHFGLGLYISRILCEKHGGNIIIQNNKNGGAKVIASFYIA